jgi:hypothetical protein
MIIDQLGIVSPEFGDWNRVWRNFFEANPSATQEQILQQLKQMKLDFGI